MSISSSICLCQPLSFSCISSTIFHYFSVFFPSFPLRLSALIEAVAARRVRRYLIRRLNRRCGPMANPSANKRERERRLHLRRPAPPPPRLRFHFQFQSVSPPPVTTKLPPSTGSTLAPIGRRDIKGRSVFEGAFFQEVAVQMCPFFGSAPFRGAKLEPPCSRSRSPLALTANAPSQLHLVVNSPPRSSSRTAQTHKND